MNRWRARIIPFLICFVFAMSGCSDVESSKHEKSSDFIIPVNITERLTYPEAEVLGYFQERREDFVTLGGYLLENEHVFQTRPVILQPDTVELIQDPAIQSFAERLFEEGMVKVVFSSNDDPNKHVTILVDSDDGFYQQGITYLSPPELPEKDPSILSYVKTYKELGDGWYYYVYHYETIKEENQYRDLAWGHLSEQVRSTLNTSKEKAIVTLNTGATVSHWISERKPELVVSVQFNTQMDGLLGPITMFFDPVTKELVGSASRY